MENKNKNQKKGSIIPALVIFLAITAYNVMDNPRELAVFVPVIAIAVVFALIALAAKKKSGGRPAAEKARPAAAPAKKQGARPNVFQHKDEEMAEEAVHCAHAKGKEKYIQQLDSYLKAGLIDRAEYKLMKERYSKLDIPDDYH